MKKFFEKAKLEIKFRKAGDGHAVNESKPMNRPSTSQQIPTSRVVPASSARKAGQAALERFGQHEKAMLKKPKSAKTTWKHGTTTQEGGGSAACSGSSSVDCEKLRAEAYQEVEAERIKQSTMTPRPVSTEPNIAEELTLSVEGIYFSCPLCPVSVPQTGTDGHLKACLENKYTEEPLVAASTMIQSLNKDKEKIKACVDILCRYIDNICQNAEEEKFKKIKQSNRIFQERVSTIIGAVEFLLACGFENKTVLVEDKEEQFYVLSEDKGQDTETLELYKGILLSVEPVKLTLDRSTRVYQPSSNSMKFELPEEFFSVSSEEVKREYQLKKNEVEQNSQLRTKAMREAEKKPIKTYRFTLIRVRFPDGIILQGTFYSRERLRHLFEFIRQWLESDWLPFILSDPTGQLTNEDSTLSDLGLVPAAVVNFAWDPTIIAHIVAASGSVQQGTFLKGDLMAEIQQIR